MVSSKRTLSDLKLFGRGYLRNRIGLFFGLIFPVILILLFGAIFQGNGGKVNVFVQNQDTRPFPAPSMDVASQFINALSSTGRLNVTLVDASKDLRQVLTDNSVSDGIIVPSNFSLNYLMEIPINVTVYGNPAQSSSLIVSGTVSALANEFNLRRYNGSAVIGYTSATLILSKYIDFLVPGLVGFSILVSPMFSLVNISSEYKKIKLFKQLSLTPLTKLEWLASKVLWYIFLSTLSFLLMVGVGVILFQATIVLTVWLIPFLILGPMLFASMGMLVGTLTKSVETASVIGNVITFPMMFLSGTFFPISQMPQYLQSVAHFLPLFYVIEGLSNVMVIGNTSAALIDIAVVAVITVIVFVAAAKLFKWREE